MEAPIPQSAEAPDVDRPLDSDCHASPGRYSLAQSASERRGTGRFRFTVYRALPLTAPRRLALQERSRGSPTTFNRTLEPAGIGLHQNSLDRRSRLQGRISIK